AAGHPLGRERGCRYEHGGCGCHLARPPAAEDDPGVKAVWFRLRVEARAHWRAWFVAALLIGVVSGGAIAAFAAADRTQTAYDRFLRGTHAFDIALTNGSTPDSINRQFDFDEIAHLPA